MSAWHPFAVMVTAVQPMCALSDFVVRQLLRKRSPQRHRDSEAALRTNTSELQFIPTSTLFVSATTFSVDSTFESIRTDFLYYSVVRRKRIAGAWDDLI